MATCAPSLKFRIVKSKSNSKHPIQLSTNLNKRSVKYKTWNEESLRKAAMDVQKGVSIRRAAEVYDVPRSTLHDRVSGKVNFGSRSGPDKYLTDEEEEEMVCFLNICATLGYARSKKQVVSLVQFLVSAKGLNVKVSDGWWQGFVKRHGNLTLRAAEPLAYARAISSQPEVLNQYYTVLEETLEKHELFDKPCQIYNLDETGMPLDPRPPKVVCPKGTKHAQSIGSGSKAQITALCCCNAAGSVMPPMIIFDRQTLKPELTVGEIPGTMYGLSKNGWIDAELFELWFKHHFLTHAPPVRPLLLIMDGHSSHFQPQVIRMAAKEDIIMFVLPPHSTHLTQPLDCGCFGPLKTAWRNVCKEYLTLNSEKVTTRYQFSELFAKAWMQSMTMKNVTALGFE